MHDARLRCELRAREHRSGAMAYDPRTMFGSAKKRIATLQACLVEAEALVVSGANPSAEAIALVIEQLGPAIDDVRSNDYNVVLHDAALEAQFDRASALHAHFLEQIASKVRAARRNDDARQSPELIKKLRLRRCVQCESSAFFVREGYTFEGSPMNVKLSMVVCASCGDVRLVMPDARALAELQDDRAYVYVELPQGGTYRG